MHNPSWDNWNVVGFSNQLETRWLADTLEDKMKKNTIFETNPIPRGDQEVGTCQTIVLTLAN